MVGGTLTIVVVFLPFSLLQKQTQILFAGISFVVTASLFSSLFVALTLVPVLGSLFNPETVPDRGWTPGCRDAWRLKERIWQRISLPAKERLARWLEVPEFRRGRNRALPGAAEAPVPKPPGFPSAPAVPGGDLDPRPTTAEDDELGGPSGDELGDPSRHPRGLWRGISVSVVMTSFC